MMIDPNRLSSLVQPRDPGVVPTLGSVSGLSGYNPNGMQIGQHLGGPSILSGYDPNAQSGPGSAGQPQPVAPAKPFTWGAGAAHLSPDQLAMRQKAALANMQSDYSPVQSWTQGLARVAQNALGALQERDLDKQSAAAAADRTATVASLLAQGSGQGGTATAGPDPVAAALTSDDPELQKLGMAQWERNNPKPVNNDTVQDYNFRVQTLGKPAADDWLRRGNDPFVSVNTPTGFYAGPQSGLTAAMQGGSAPLGPPAGPAPGAVVDGYQFKGGDPNKQDSWVAVGGASSGTPGFP